MKNHSFLRIKWKKFDGGEIFSENVSRLLVSLAVRALWAGAQGFPAACKEGWAAAGAPTKHTCREEGSGRGILAWTLASSPALVCQSRAWTAWDMACSHLPSYSSAIACEHLTGEQTSPVLGHGE